MAGHEGHSHGDGPGPGAPVLARRRHRRALAQALVVVVGVLVAEVVVGILSGSLALLSDAGHMATDALGLAMALAAVHLTLAHTPGESPSGARTFGVYRLEILAALANAVLLVGVGAWVLVEAVQRLGDPPEVKVGAVLVVGAIGLVANLVGAALLRRGAGESLNVHGAYLEVLADLLGSVGVLVGATVMWATGWRWVDPVVALAIGAFVLPRAARLGYEAVQVLLQAAPRGTDVGAVRRDLASIPGVRDVHDVHVWTLTSKMPVATAHLVVGGPGDWHRVLDEARHVLAEHHGIEHATLQVEPDDHQGCDQIGW